MHHDLKPENILVTEVGEPSMQVRIIDFGLSKKNGCHLNVSVPKMTHKPFVA